MIDQFISDRVGAVGWLSDTVTNSQVLSESVAFRDQNVFFLYVCAKVDHYGEVVNANVRK